MGQRFRLHADSRHGQGQGRAGARRGRHHGSRACPSQPGTPGAEPERREYQAQTRPGFAFGKVSRAADRAGPQASAENHLLGRPEAVRPARWLRARHLDSHTRTAQSDRMIATTSRPAPAVSPADHPVLPALLSRPYPAVMGVLNVTPDSFSDGGQFIAPERALVQARRMIAEGADIIDIGAESTRPYGSKPVPADEELRRLRPILGEVVALGVPVSIDSMKSVVVAWALDAGAAIANDVWGLQYDPGMAPLLAARGSPVIVMHNRIKVDADIDIMKDIAAFFTRSLEIAAKAGVSRGNIVLDPGIGFGKTPAQSMTALARLDELSVFGLPLLVGASRKRFIASVTPSEPDQRLGGSIAAHLVAAKAGANIIRTHDVSETVQALRVAKAIWDKR